MSLELEGLHRPVRGKGRALDVARAATRAGGLDCLRAVTAARGFGSELLVGRDELPILEAGEERLEVLYLSFPDNIFRGCRIEGAGITVAAEVRRAEPGHKVAAGHTEVPGMQRIERPVVLPPLVRIRWCA